MLRSEFVLHTPVLFIIFNRPGLTEKVFQALRAARPRTLYIAADGPRRTHEFDEALCAEARKVVTQVDWPCDVHTRFLAHNLGCRDAVSSAISWFFSQNERGIILEDDCLPNADFFSFCQEMLAHYADDHRIMHIGGTNYQDGQMRGDCDIYFSKFNHVWGWATWRRAWQAYDVDLKGFSFESIQKTLRDINSSRTFRLYWTRIFRMTHNKKIDTWDYQWTYAIWNSGGLSIIPQKNLVSNLGFGPDATHTQGKSRNANMETASFRIVRLPTEVTVHNDADEYTIRKHLGIPRSSLAYFLQRIRDKIRPRQALRKALDFLSKVHRT